MRIIVGAVVSLPPYTPGIVWHVLQYLAGFRRLGHEVYYLEQTKPEWCVDAQGQRCELERSRNRELFRTTMERFDLVANAGLICGDGDATVGLSRDAIMAIAKDADVLINMSGCITADFVLSNVKQRVYVDQDPVYTQLWPILYGADLNFEVHDVFFSMGLNIGTAHTRIPDCGLEWHHVRPPVIPDYWPFRIDSSCTRFTTIASLRGFAELCYEGEWYGSKHEEFIRFAQLPRRVNQEFAVALKYYSGWESQLALLKDNGWILSDADRIGDLASYQNYITTSRAEIGIVQNAYVKARSGWFGERWSHYLITGRPVLAQSTGFERSIPTGRGLLTFTTLDEAVAGVEEINRNYEKHCRAAREIAEAYFDYRTVLPPMLELCTTARRSGTDVPRSRTS